LGITLICLNFGASSRRFDDPAAKGKGIASGDPFPCFSVVGAQPKVQGNPQSGQYLGAISGPKWEKSAAVVAAFLALGHAAKNDTGGQENRGDGSVGEAEAQIAMVHGERGVEEPNRGAEIPDPIEISAH